MKAGDINLKTMLNFDSENGKVLLGQDRMLVFRQEAFLELRKLLYTQLGKNLARAILTQFGFRCGIGDHKNLSTLYKWDSEIDDIASGPTLHTWEGIVQATPTLLEFDRKTGHFHMKGIWRNSYEAEIHVKEFGLSSEPICHSLTGYASGWASGFFGSDLLAIETKCVGKGDEQCEFEIRPINKWGNEAESFQAALSATSSSIARELEDNLKVIQQQAEAIRELSTPVMEVWDDVLVLPVIGIVDTKRSLEIMEILLERIVTSQSRCVIIDITGVEIVDTKTADYLLKVVKAAQLLGVYCVLTGINPAVAQTLVEIGAELSTVKTLRNLKAGLMECIRYIRAAKSTKGGE